MTIKKTIEILILFITLTLSTQSYAKELTGKIIKVVDGDTIHILVEGNKTKKVRLSSIDSPERKQPYYKKAKRHLSQLIANKKVKIVWDRTDRNKRIIGQIFYNGTDINLEMVIAGYAWHYKYYEKYQPESEQKSYSTAGNFAMSYGVGLFADSKAIPPWEWRRMKRMKYKKKAKK